ncbi:MAG TPA: class I SAM-dependent methyltransferase [Thermomicrobiales bacterium]|nr:class I SAM-dependent methyltransferase [Thermomicrobiales bacterium]
MKRTAEERANLNRDDGRPGSDPNIVEAGSPASLERVFAFLSRTPDLDALRAAYPTLTDDDLRACFGEACAALAPRAPTIRYRKGASQTTFARTHGLPEPDPTIHKGFVFKMLLGLFKPGRLLDLGAGKGNFSLAAAQLGWTVTAVDARTVRWPDPERAADPAEAELIRQIRWVQADVREFPIAPGDYDLICILGLLHHLEVADQVALLGRCASAPLLIDTRIAKANLDHSGPYEGMLIREHGATRDERDLVPTAAWGNALSFQHTEDSLIRLARDAGYAKVLPMRPPHRNDYTFYLCLPPPTAAERAEARAGRGKARERRAAGGRKRDG